MTRFLIRCLSICLATALEGCGTHVPRLEEPGEVVELPRNLEYRIKDYLFCQTVRALKRARVDITYGGAPLIPDTFGVQMQVTLTVDENTSFNPGLSLNKTYGNAIVSGVTVGQTSNVGLGATISSDATRVDTLYSYYNIGRISAPGKNEDCLKPLDQHGSSPLLQSDLGIYEFLEGAAPQARILKSSPGPTLYKDAKLDIYSYDVKFVIVTNGNVTPTWKLVNVSANTGSSPFFGLGRTRTHELLLTFGPGISAPSSESLQTHFTTQIVQALDRIRPTAQ